MSMTDFNNWDEGTWVGVVFVIMLLLGTILGVTCMITKAPQECHEFAETTAWSTKPSADEIKARYERCVADRAQQGVETP